MNDYVIESVSKVYINDELITPVPATIERFTNENIFYLRKPLNESKSNELVSKIVKFFDKDGMIVAKIIWNPDEPGDVNKVKIIGTMRNVIKDKVEPMDFTWEVPGRALINVTRWSRNSDVESRN